MHAPAPRRSLWPLGVTLAVAVFVFTRVRGEFAFYVAIHRWLKELGLPDAARALDGQLLLVVASLLAARLAWGRGETLRGLGLRASFVTGAWFALVAGAPMVLQAALASSGLRADLGTWRGVLVAPLVEELLFRAVFVAIPVRLGGWPFWPVAAFSALVFASTHVPWNAQFGFEHVGVLAATLAGGLWYAWLLRVYDWNLWTTILLHAVMNAAWMVFAVADSAAGGVWPNVGRGLTIAAGTVLAVRHRRRLRAARG